MGFWTFPIYFLFQVGILGLQVLGLVHLAFFVSLFCFVKQGFLSWNSLYRSGWFQTHRDLCTPASQMLGLKEYAATTWMLSFCVASGESGFRV